MANAKLQQVLENLQARYKPGVIDRETVYYLSLGDDPAEKWTVTLTPTGCSAVPGRVRDAHCVLKTRADLFIKLVEGGYQPSAMDVMTGKLKTSNLELLVRLREAFGI